MSQAPARPPAGTQDRAAAIPFKDLRKQTLEQHSAEILSLGCVGVASIYTIIVLLSLAFPVPWDTPLTITATASVAAAAWASWLCVRLEILPEGCAQQVLFGLQTLMGLQTGFVLFVIGEPIHSGNQIMVMLSASFFLTARPWFYAAIGVVAGAWLPAAVTGFAVEAQQSDWNQWARLLLVSMALAIAFFEARRRSVLRTYQLKLDAEAALATAQEANRSRSAMQQMMQESQRREALGVLAGGIAHDFNNLLAVIKGNLDLMTSAPEQLDDTDAMLGEMTKASNRAIELTQQMLVYAGRSKPKISTIDLAERIRSAARLMASSVPAGVRVSLHGTDQGPHIPVDSTLLDQMIINVIQNAIEACDGKGGEVQISWQEALLTEEQLAEYRFAEAPQEGRYALIQVEDDGIGMDSETQLRMFEPFFSAKQNGNGLGLAVVTGILESHGAGFAVASAPNEGTRLRLAIPSDPLVAATDGAGAASCR